MMKRVLPALAGLVIFAGVGYYWGDSSWESSFRLASAERDACYASRGYNLNRSDPIPPAVSAECTQSFRAHEEGQNQRLLTAGLIGLVAGGIGMALLGFLLRGAREA